MSVDGDGKLDTKELKWVQKALHVLHYEQFRGLVKECDELGLLDHSAGKLDDQLISQVSSFC